MIFRPNPRRGFALIAVIGVMVMLIVLLAAMQGSVGVTVAQDGVLARRLDRQAATATILSLHVAENAPTSETLRLAPGGGPELVAAIQRRPLAPGDRVWQRLPGVRPLDGDGLLTITWVETAEAEQWLMNTRQRRGGAIRLGAIADQPASITTPLAE